MTDIRKLYILLCGYEIIRKSGCIRGEQPNIILALPICCYLMETARGFVMFDAGLDSQNLSDVMASRARYVNDRFPSPPVVLPEHEILPQLAALGVEPEDIVEIVLSHAHGDHTGHLNDFPNARVTIQKMEYEAAFADTGRANFAEYGSPSIRWNIIDGDTELMPGLDLVLTRGHQPGHQSAVVRLPDSGVKILIGDVADLLENFEREVLGSSMDDAAAIESIRRLKRIAENTAGELIPLHDPNFVQSARLAPLFYS
ncbi:N-acyl homoserine lactonase family protein [Rhizobium johnstonii]|uniref:N-acyl homoserine lactonase family protein n=1 Tax=Rhizobium TaxID=379 RepID=UPI00103262B8|nr:N-acyl homoserine lactonase family protein [Rhizobium leguminosarum]TBH50262.1 N-acyl homoserine lactonase family protein [Rhizobium leguminosarum]